MATKNSTRRQAAPQGPCPHCMSTAERVKQVIPAIRAPMLRKLREVSEQLDMHADSFGQLSALFWAIGEQSADTSGTVARLCGLGNYTAENYGGLMLSCKFELDGFIAEKSAEAEA